MWTVYLSPNSNKFSKVWPSWVLRLGVSSVSTHSNIRPHPFLIDFAKRVRMVLMVFALCIIFRWVLQTFPIYNTHTHSVPKSPFLAGLTMERSLQGLPPITRSNGPHSWICNTHTHIKTFPCQLNWRYEANVATTNLRFAFHTTFFLCFLNPLWTLMCCPTLFVYFGHYVES